jgi:hypothetical protein
MCVVRRTCIERTDRGSLNGDSLIDLIGLVLDNAAIGVSRVMQLAQQLSVQSDFTVQYCTVPSAGSSSYLQSGEPQYSSN